MTPALAVYREFAPRAALQPYVRAFFSFTPGAEGGRPSRQRTCEILALSGDAVCPPVLADGHACLSFTLGVVCHADAGWRAAPAGCSGHIVGAVTHADGAPIARLAMIGAYFHAGGLAAFTRVPLHELTNHAVRVEDIWGPDAAGIAARLAESGEAARIDVVESLLLDRLGARHRTPHVSVDVPGLAALIERRAGRVRVEQLTGDAGVSRQRLARTFRERVGVTPKLYARLARFHASLAYTRAGEAADGADTALALGYADQSHWIAEFREFSGLTPHSFAARRWFHPFVERAVRGRSGG